MKTFKSSSFIVLYNAGPYDNKQKDAFSTSEIMSVNKLLSLNYLSYIKQQLNTLK